MAPDLLSATAGAKYVGLSRTHIGNLIAAGDLPAVDIAPSTATRPAYRIRVADLDAFMAARRVKPKQAKAADQADQDEDADQAAKQDAQQARQAQLQGAAR